MAYWHLQKAPRHLAYLLALIAVVAAAYSNSFSSGLVFDNARIIGEDPRIRHANLDSVSAIVHGQYWFNNSTSGLYRPLTTLSYLMNYAVLGNETNPAGYHAVNLLLHAANVALVYAIGWILFGDALLAFLLAACWGLHPLLTESATNIVGRADLLAGLGALAGLWLYARGASWVWIGAAQAIGIFSKESAIVLPALMLLYDFSLRRKPDYRAYAGTLLPIGAFFWMRTVVHSSLLVNFPENPLIRADFVTSRVTAFKVIARYVALFVWPSALSADHSFNAVPVVVDFIGILALIGCAAAIALAMRSGRLTTFFTLFFFVAMAPTANVFLIVGSIMAERFIYLPALGLAGLTVYACSRWNRRISVAALACVCAAFGARTFARNIDWTDGLSLWSSAVEAEPDAARAHSNLAYEYMKTGRMTEALQQYREALRIDARNPDIHFNFGNALLASGHVDDAVAEFRAAVSGSPAFAEANNNLGNALLQSGGVNAAIEAFQAALHTQPDYAAAHNGLANAYLRIPKLDAAIAECREAIRIDPRMAEAHANLGAALLASGSAEEAEVELHTAIQIRPELSDAHFNRANALLRLRRNEDAIAELKTLLALRDDPEARAMLNELQRHP